MNITRDRFDYTVDVRSPKQVVGNYDPQKLKSLYRCSRLEPLKTMLRDEGRFLLEWINMHFDLSRTYTVSIDYLCYTTVAQIIYAVNKVNLISSYPICLKLTVKHMFVLFRKILSPTRF